MKQPSLLRRVSLGTLLSGLNAALLLVILSVIGALTLSLVARLIDEQARTRVAQAAERAALMTTHLADETAADARLLAQRPTLQRLAANAAYAELTTFLTAFAAAADLDGAALLSNGSALAVGGTLQQFPSQARDGVLRQGPDLLLLGSAAVNDAGQLRVMTVRRLTPARLSLISSEVGLPVSVSAPLASTAAQRSVTRTAQDYLAVLPLPDSSGRTVALLTVRLPVAEASAPLTALTLTLISLVIAAGLIGAAINLYAGRLLGRPLRRLAQAAAALGAGDLTRRIPTARSSELATLAGALEHARLQLQLLTGNLQRREAEQAAVLQGISDGVIAVDSARRIRYLNQQAAALLAIEPAAAIGQFCGDVLQPRAVGGRRPCEQQCPLLQARTDGSTRVVEQLQLPDGRLRSVVLTAAAPVDDVQVQIIRDETEQETGRRLRDTILATISHEFRTPLTAQLASIELLIDQLDDLPPDQVRRLVETLQRSTLRLTRLVDNLLESARVEAGRLAMRRTAVDLDAVIEEACEQMRPLLEQRRQYVVVDLPYPLPQLQGDPQRLTQVFVNLIVNAHKFSPADAAITISAGLTADSVILTVHDSGPGSPLFVDGTPGAPFVRALGDEPDQSGTGLGLWISTSIIERHGGTIRAHHAHDGTRVVIHLPVTV